MTSLPRAWIPRARSSASGASGSAPNASRGWRSSPAAGAPPAFPPSVVVEVKALACELPARRGVPAGALVAGRVAAGSDGPGARRADQRGHALAVAQPGCAPALAPSQLDLPPRSRVRRQGGPDPGPVRTALAGPALGAGTTSCAPTRRPASRSGGGAIRPCRRARAGQCTSSMSTSAVGPGPIWPRGTCIAPRCSAAVNPRPGTRRSSASSPR